jgi:hypothetical protein
VRLNEEYGKLWELTLQYRSLLTGFSERMRGLEAAKKAEIEQLRAARPARLQGDSGQAQQRMAELKAEFGRLDKELGQLKSQTDPEVEAAREKWAEGLGQMAALCGDCGVALPWQISSGTFLLPPRAEGKQGIPPQGGLPNWRVICTGCGDEIEWGSVGEGTPRWKDLDHDGRTFCQDCYHVLKDSLGDALFVQEFKHPIWIHEDFLAKARPASNNRTVILSLFVAAALKTYADRPCVYENGRWVTFREVSEMARRIGAWAKKWGSVGFTGVLNPRLAIAAIGVLLAGIPLVPAADAEFVFSSENLATDDDPD